MTTFAHHDSCRPPRITFAIPEPTLNGGFRAIACIAERGSTSPLTRRWPADARSSPPEVGGPMDMIAEGSEGHLVDPFDACALADRLVDVLSLPEDRWHAMSDAAYRRARLETWSDAADRFERGLRLAIERDRPRTAG